MCKKHRPKCFVCRLWSNGLVDRRWIPNPDVSSTKPLVCSKVDSGFYLTKVDQMSIGISLGGSG